MAAKAWMTLVCGTVALAACGAAERVTERITQTVAPGPQTVDGVALDPDWQDRYTPDVPFVNITDAQVPIYSSPTATVVTGLLQPTEGGRVDGCVLDRPVCRLIYKGDGSGWVNMSAMGPRAL